MKARIPSRARLPDAPVVRRGLGTRARPAAWSLALALLGCPATGISEPPPTAEACEVPGFDPTEFVDPFIGTAAHGHTFPGATRPFGMVQLSPDTRLSGWDGCSGYHWDDDVVYGFSHTHLSGTGIADYADVLLMPVAIGEGPQAPVGDPRYPQAARFDHAQEHATPGWYHVRLHEPAVDVELTATPRVGIHRYTFDGSGQPALDLDLRHRDEVLDAWVEPRSPTRLVGLRRSRSWARDQRVYFALELSRPLASIERLSEAETTAPEDGTAARWSGNDVRLRLHPTEGSDPLMVKVALSAVDAAGAERNLEAEAPHWDFAAYRDQAHDDWKQSLDAIALEGGTEAQRRIFYTALYHSMIAPNLWEDVDDRFRGIDGQIHQAPDFTVHTVFSLWDTFRATHPLLTILEPERTADFVQTLVVQGTLGGRLPMWELAANYTGTMIGYHAVSVIADAWTKGIRDFDAEDALVLALESADADRLGLPGYREHGYVPAELEHESVSKTLEYAYDDWCIAQLAEGLGRTDQAERFWGRAQAWNNLFDPQHGLFRARIHGGWVPDFEPREVNLHYTEANAWQYGFFVPHDVGGLVARHGGPAMLEQRLDRLFTETSDLAGRDQVDITGMIGQYAHGNEPSHHAAYLYPYVGQAPKTQARVREIMDTLYTDAPDGLSGNDDCGQLSSWYVLSALGFYPLAPGSDVYVLGTPLFSRAQIDLPGGGDFVIEARGLSDEAIYVQGVTLDGEPREQATLRHAEIVAGGHLVFEMGPAPHPAWGAIEPAPPLAEGPHAAMAAPVIEAPSGSFVDTMQVTLSLPWGEGTMRYAFGEGPPYDGSPIYDGPLTLTTTTTVTAAAFDGDRRGPWTTATFHRRPHDWTVTLGAEPNRSYRAGGPVGLIDGRRGTEHWRTGGWQGYQDTDFEATIDMGKVRAVHEVRVGLLQDARAWIWMPKDVQVEVSLNGSRWKPIGTAGHDVPDREMDRVFVETLSVKAPASTRARYVRVRATNYGTIPPWHPGHGAPAFVFVDEVEID